LSRFSQINWIYSCFITCTFKLKLIDLVNIISQQNKDPSSTLCSTSAKNYYFVNNNDNIYSVTECHIQHGYIHDKNNFLIQLHTFQEKYLLRKKSTMHYTVLCSNRTVVHVSPISSSLGTRNLYIDMHGGKFEDTKEVITSYKSKTLWVRIPLMMGCTLFNIMS
jgi:hypothetical protein